MLLPADTFIFKLFIYLFVIYLFFSAQGTQFPRAVNIEKKWNMYGKVTVRSQKLGTCLLGRHVYLFIYLFVYLPVFILFNFFYLAALIALMC